jgi:hypothetical protein
VPVGLGDLHVHLAGLHERDRDRLRAMQAAPVAPLDVERDGRARDGVGLVMPAPHARDGVDPELLDSRELRRGDELDPVVRLAREGGSLHTTMLDK